MDRRLSSRERDVLLEMIEHAPAEDESPVPAADRAAWRARVPELMVVGGCGCGTCPSISLASSSASTTCRGQGRVVLTSGLGDALVLLFIDEGVPGYLELAPIDDEVSYSEFPDPAALRF